MVNHRTEPAVASIAKHPTRGESPWKIIKSPKMTSEKMWRYTCPFRYEMGIIKNLHVFIINICIWWVSSSTSGAAAARCPTKSGRAFAEGAAAGYLSLAVCSRWWFNNNSSCVGRQNTSDCIYIYIIIYIYNHINTHNYTYYNIHISINWHGFACTSSWQCCCYYYVFHFCLVEAAEKQYGVIPWISKLQPATESLHADDVAFIEATHRKTTCCETMTIKHDLKLAKSRRKLQRSVCDHPQWQVFWLCWHHQVRWFLKQNQWLDAC